MRLGEYLIIPVTTGKGLTIAYLETVTSFSKLLPFYLTRDTAIVSDTDHASDYGNYVQTIEAVGSGVRYGVLDDTRMVNFGVVILRVVGATESDRRTAIYFAQGQIGKPYELNTFRLNMAYNSSMWYCSEMVYAAYKYTGIDIGVKKDASGRNIYLDKGCLPADIYNSYNTYNKCIVNRNYIDVQLVYGGKWQVRIYNNTGFGQTVY